MNNHQRPVAKGCGILAAIALGLILLVVGIVSVKTMVPLQRAGDSMAELEQSLGDAVNYTPSVSGNIPAGRMELFLKVRTELVVICDEYGTIRQAFDSIETLESQETLDMAGAGNAASGLGGAALDITPFLASFFEARNGALLRASMGLPEYSYIYAVAYHEHLLSPAIRAEIFSDGDALSPAASVMLGECLGRQREKMLRDGATPIQMALLEAEIQRMTDDPTHLIWQDGLPVAVLNSLAPYRERLDRMFCGATAGLELESTSGRAIRTALE